MSLPFIILPKKPDALTPNQIWSIAYLLINLLLCAFPFPRVTLCVCICILGPLCDPETNRVVGKGLGFVGAVADVVALDFSQFPLAATLSPSLLLSLLLFALRCSDEGLF